MIYFHKILPQIFSPLVFIIVLLIIGIIFKSKKISLIGLTILIIFSLPIISNRLTIYLESNYSIKHMSEVNQADAIVVLSGMVRTIRTKDGLKYEFNDAVDRIISGIKLYKSNKAPLLILTRGKVPWSIGIAEGEYLLNIAMKFDIPRTSIILTDNVQNTDQEAKSIKKLLTNRKLKIILVNSAFHMPRAQNVFEAVDI